MSSCPSSCHCPCHRETSVRYPTWRAKEINGSLGWLKNFEVNRYFEWLAEVHTCWKKMLPCSWIVYHSVAPDDYTELMEAMRRVFYVCMFFAFVSASAISFGVSFFVLPCIPVIVDLTRLVYCLVFEDGEMESGWVESYNKSLNVFHDAWKKQLPCSWIVYHCFALLDDTTDLIELMSRISYLAPFYIYIATSAASFGTSFLLLPLTPFFIDLTRLACRWVWKGD